MPAAVSPTNSKISFATKPHVRANDVDVIAIKVRVKDINNAVIPSRAVEIFTDAPNVTITQPQPTDNAGLAVGYARCSAVGPVVFRARVLPDVDPQIPGNSAGAVTITNTATANFYDETLEPEVPPTASLRNVHLTWSVSRYLAYQTDGIRVRIEAEDSNLMPTKIFAYQMLPVRPGEEDRVGTFDHVCSPVDLEEYPEDQPLPNSRPAWFRLDYVDVLLRSRAEVKAFINSVVEDVRALKTTLDITEDLVPDGDLWIGTPPEEN
jgi:hypothetical protein